MLHHQDIDVADDDLPDKEDDRLHALAEGSHLPRPGFTAQSGISGGQQIGGEHRQRNASHGAHHAGSHQHEGNRRNQLHQRLDAQTDELTGALHSATAHTQGDVEQHPKRKHLDQPLGRQAQVVRDWFAQQQQRDTEAQAHAPGLPHQRPVDGGAPACLLVTRDEFGRHQLKRQVDAGGEHEQRNRRRGVTEVAGSQKRH